MFFTEIQHLYNVMYICPIYADFTAICELKKMTKNVQTTRLILNSKNYSDLVLKKYAFTYSNSVKEYFMILF